MSSSSSSSANQELSLRTTFEVPALAASNSRDLLLMASLEAPAYESDERTTRAPIDLVCVIDKSGSMSGEKLSLVRDTLEFMIDQLKSEDSISIVTFDTDVSCVLELTEMSDSNREKTRAIIKSIHAGSSTNLSGGIFRGLEVVKGRTRPKDVVSLLVFTDGLANHGITGSNEIVSAMNNVIKDLNAACSVYTFGFGADHDPNMLRAIAEAANGMYYYIQKVDEIPQAFADCLGGLLSVVAQNIRVKFEVIPQNASIVKVLSNFKTTENNKGLDVELQLGDIFSEEKRDLIVQVKIGPTEKPTTNESILKVTLSYFNVINSNLRTFVFYGTLERPETITGELQYNMELDKQRNRIITADAMDSGRKLADSNRLAEGREIVQNAINQISSSYSAQDPFCAGLILDLKNCLANMNDSSSYTKVGAKVLNNFTFAHKMQRGTHLESAAQQSYETSEKAKKKHALASFMAKRV